MGARERLAQLIQESGMTQSEIARRLSPNGENPQWINNRLRGISQIKADDLPRIAAALRISPCRFFEDVHTHQAATPSYADTFTRALAQAWLEMTTADQELLTTLLDALRRHRDQLAPVAGSFE